MAIQEQGGESFPFVIFKINGGLYCVNSKYIETLSRLPKFETLPEMPPAITGIFPYRDTFITMFDMRTAFGMPSLSEEFDAFSLMLDQRKEDHARWVEELERTARSGEAFQLSSDPHACAFGKWYDHFESDSYVINTHMKKIDEPHKRLHLAAEEVAECLRISDRDRQEETLEAILKRVKEESMPAILRLLDETKDIFHSVMFHEMVLILSDARLGLVVDEVLVVDELPPVRDQLDTVHGSPLVSGIRRSKKFTDVILELDVPRLLEAQAAGRAS